jgi:hypothetical protein
MVGICMPNFDHNKVTAFEIDHISLELLGKYEALRNLAWKTHVPEARDLFCRGLLAHDLQNFGRCNRFGIGKPIQESSDAKEMIAVAVEIEGLLPDGDPNRLRSNLRVLSGGG